MTVPSLKNCVITGVPTMGGINIFKHLEFIENIQCHRYWIKVGDDEVEITITREILIACTKKQGIYNEIEKNRVQLIGYFLEDIKARFGSKLITWEGDQPSEIKTIRLKYLIEELNTDGSIPQKIGEKYDNMLVSLYDMLPTEASELVITTGIELYGKLFFRSF